MTENTYGTSTYRFQRPDLPHMEIAGELKSDEPISHIDAAIGFLSGADQALRLEHQCCAPRGERAEKVAELLVKAREIRHILESFPVE